MANCCLSVSLSHCTSFVLFAFVFGMELVSDSTIGHFCFVQIRMQIHKYTSAPARARVCVLFQSPKKNTRSHHCDERICLMTWPIPFNRIASIYNCHENCLIAFYYEYWWCFLSLLPYIPWLQAFLEPSCMPCIELKKLFQTESSLRRKQTGRLANTLVF